METGRGKRDRAILALLIGCGLRRAELVGLKNDDFQLREDHWVLADLIGKGKHILAQFRCLRGRNVPWMTGLMRPVLAEVQSFAE